MKLLVNISSIGQRSTGMGVYAVRCAQAACSAFDCDVVAAEGATDFRNVVLRAPLSHTLGAGGGAALKRWAWSRRQRTFRDRLLYSPTHHALPKADAQIITIHDLIALRFRRQHPLQYLFFRYQVPKELARCAAVFTVSETSRHDIHTEYGYPLDRIRVVPNGVDRSVFQPAPHKTRQPFLLVVGAAFPHKNVEEVLANAPLWRDRYQLVIASCRGPYREALQAMVNEAGLRERVRFLHYAPLSELVDLYQTCAALICPSRWEGFGIPPIEAMACGAPVIASDIPAHREVLGDRGCFVRLGDPAAWARAFENLAVNDGLTVRAFDGAFVAAGNRASPIDHYTWEHSARTLTRELLDVEPRLAADLRSSFTNTG